MHCRPDVLQACNACSGCHDALHTCSSRPNETLFFGMHAAAIHLLGGGINAKSIGNLNFLSNNPSVANFDTGTCCTAVHCRRSMHYHHATQRCKRPHTGHDAPMRCILPSPCKTSGFPKLTNNSVCSTGYQYLVIVFFLVVFPLNLLIRSFASTTAILYAWRKAGADPLRAGPAGMAQARMRARALFALVDDAGRAWPVVLPCGVASPSRPALSSVRGDAAVAGDPENCPDCKPTWIPPLKVMLRNLSAVWPRCAMTPDPPSRLASPRTRFASSSGTPMHAHASNGSNPFFHWPLLLVVAIPPCTG